MPNTPTYILYHGKAAGNKSGKGFNLTWEYLLLGDGVTVMLPYDTDRGEASPPTV